MYDFEENKINNRAMHIFYIYLMLWHLFNSDAKIYT